KVEGNPQHPASPQPIVTPAEAAFGPTDVFSQASILGLYDPDRSQAVTHLGDPSSWDAFTAALNGLFQSRGANLRLRVLTGTVTSPTLTYQLQELPHKFPQARWHRYEPAGTDNARQGARQAFGRPVETHYRLDRAGVILSLDADFLSCGPGHLLYVRDFSAKRRGRPEARSRGLDPRYLLESRPTGTAARGDHCLPLAAAHV